MPSSAELIRQQQLWEGKRGLDKWNTYESRMGRLQEEVDEAWEAYEDVDDIAFMLEICDVVIFAHSILGALCEDRDIAPEAIDHFIQWKMNQNEKKYPVSLFDKFDPKTAIEISRELWYRNHPKKHFPDDYEYYTPGSSDD